MNQNGNHLQAALDTKIESINLAEEMCTRVAQSAGFSEEDSYRIAMAVREGMINAFHYGNCECPNKKIFLSVDVASGKMTIHIVDEGKGFDLQDIPNPLAEENLLSPSGRGIFLMRSFMDEFEVRPGSTGGAEIVMSKKLPEGAAANARKNCGAAPRHGA
ncbi:MAG: hypothetical protein NVS9B4_02960 [Candidatus Acidiferrum sp.]